MTVRRPAPFSTVGIVGFGLMGGAVARDLKALPVPPRVRALSLDPRDLEAGLSLGVLDQASGTPEEFLEGLDLVLYATPLSVTLSLLEDHAGVLGGELLITDVVSLKEPLLEKVRALGLSGRYVGSHPMAGGEGQGFSNSRAGIFQGRRVWVVEGDAPPDVVGRITDFWETMGGSPVLIGAGEHDAMMTWVSHLPQLASNALALALEQGGFSRDTLGTGGLDMTRLALSSPNMWADLMASAPGEIQTSLKTMIGFLREFVSLLEDENIDEIVRRMERTNLWAEGEP